MNAIDYLMHFILDFYLMMVLLRLWLQFVRADFYNPISQFSFKLTQFAVLPLSKVLPRSNLIDFSCLVLAFVVGSLDMLLKFYHNDPFPRFIDCALCVIFILLKNFGSILFWSILLKAILSWVSRAETDSDYILTAITEPFLYPLRRILPDLGGIDISPMIVLFLISFVNKLISGLNFTLLGSSPIGSIWSYA